MVHSSWVKTEEKLKPFTELEHTIFQSFFTDCKSVHHETMQNETPNVGLEPTTLGLRVPCSTD